MTTPCKILIVDSQTIMREGLRSMLAGEVEYDVVATLGGVEPLMDAIRTHAPDVIMMDIAMPGTSGTDAIAEIKRRYRTVRVIALTFHKEGQSIYAALKAGADAYVLKDDSRFELFGALSSVRAGKMFLSPSICATVVQGYLGMSERNETLPVDTLTKREREVMKLIAEGYKTREIAVLLSLSPKTVEKHRTNLMRKLDLHNVSAVTLFAIQNGIASG